MVLHWFDLEELEMVLRCAQAAILNPSVAFEPLVPTLKGEPPQATRKEHADVGPF